MLRNNVFINSLFAFPFTGAHRNDIIWKILKHTKYLKHFFSKILIEKKPNEHSICIRIQIADG